MSHLRIFFLKAVEEGNLATVKRLIETNKFSNAILNDALIRASMEGQENIIEYLMTMYKPSREILNEAFVTAAAYNHLDLADYFISKGATDIDNALSEAANSESDTVAYLLDLGPSENGIWNAIAETRDDNALEVFLKSGTIDMNSVRMKSFAKDTLSDQDLNQYLLLIKYGYLAPKVDIISIFENQPEAVDPLLNTILSRIEHDNEDWEYYYDKLTKIYKEIKDERVRTFLAEMRSIHQLI
jgi:hypothetical protein